MKHVKVSIIIPTYRGSDHLGEAIQSVLDQLYPDWELLVVDDCSPDQTSEVLKQYSDPRIRTIRHEQNLGSDIARNTGLKASTGEIIAFLDQDDLFHPEKLQAHVAFLDRHPDIGFTYNGRFELNYSSKSVREIWRPPYAITLQDLVLWFPLSPSDVMLRREWALQMDLIGGSRGAEIFHFGRLYLDGCKFGCVDRALNYRRYHSGRVIKDLTGSCESEIHNQVRIFTDPRCPAEVKALRNIGHANIYQYWAFLAFAQGETTIGQEFIRNAIRYKPSILKGTPGELVDLLVINCIADENLDHAAQLQKIFAQFPQEIAWLSQQLEGALAQGYFLKGARATMWDRNEDGNKYFEEAIRLGFRIDKTLITQLASKLLDYEAEFGEDSAKKALQAWTPFVEQSGGKTSVRGLNGTYAANRAFQNYRMGEFGDIPGTVMRAVASDPKYLMNRGVLSVLLRSTVGQWAKNPKVAPGPVPD